MSRLITPVALPPLPIGIFDTASGKQLRTTTLDDPRVGFCKHYNELNDERYAQPIDLAQQAESEGAA